MAVYKDTLRGTYMYRTTYRDFTGQLHWKTKRGFAKMSEAKRAEAEFLAQRDMEGIENQKMKYSELYTQYLENQKAKNKESTHITTDSKIKNHVLPYFGEKKIADITIADIEKWHNQLLSMNKYSIVYLQGIHSKFSSTIKYAIKLGYLNKNVVEMHGNFTQTSKYRKKEMLFFTPKEWEKFEGVLPEDIYKLYFQFLYYTGAREGESLALKFSDFSEDFSKVHISETITYKTKKKGIDITPAKTHTSTRTVTIPNKLMQLLQQHYENCKEYEGFNRDCFVFGIQKPVSVTTINRRKDKACKAAGVKRIRLHDFRHSHCSLLINAEVPPIAIAKRLGHADVATTLKVYAHMFESTEDKALELLNERVGG